ncbi:MAG: ethanolamine permease [Bacteroidota bacterium]
MAEKERIGSIAYSEVEEGYFKKRELRRYARAIHIWGLGVGAVISGDFFGWNFGLASGGFGGLLIATLIITVMYLSLSFSIAEMSAALPHTGGAYSFARSSMGPWGGYITGLAENMEYILTPAVIVVGIGGYLGAVFGTPDSVAPLWWLLAYGMFVGMNIWGVEASFNFSVFIAFLALAILAVFCIGAISHLDFNRFALDIPPGPGGTRFLPKGVPGILAALPFAIWFYLGIEELPLASEEAHDPKRDIPRGMVFGIITLIIASLAVLYLNTAIAPGAAAISTSEEPLFEGFKTIFGDGMATKILALIAVAGLIASFHTVIFAYGRQIFSLSRAGYFPRFLSVTHSSRQTPHVALIAGATLGMVMALAIRYISSPAMVAPFLLHMAVFGAVISYMLQMVSFILLRIRMPHIERPYRSPFGLAGAVFTLIVAGITLVTMFIVDPAYLTAVIGAAVWYALGLIYFAAVARHRLVKSPEEEFAIVELEKGRVFRADAALKAGK